MTQCVRGCDEVLSVEVEEQGGREFSLGVRPRIVAQLERWL